MGLFRSSLKLHLASLEPFLSPCLPVCLLPQSISHDIHSLTGAESVLLCSENKLDEEQERLSFLRIKIQLNMVSKEEVPQYDWEIATKELEKYTVGSARTVSDYETASGVSFKQGQLTELATSGNVSPDMFADNVLASLLAGYLK